MALIRETIGPQWARYVEQDVIATNEYGNREYHTNLTFLGTLEAFYEEISKRWEKEETKLGYDRDYVGNILPNMPGHNYRTIDTYTLDDIDETMRQIRESGQISSAGIYRAYADTTLQGFRRLIRIVFEAGAKHGVCDDLFWGSVDSLEKITPTNMRVYMKRIRRSLTPDKEKALYNRLFKNPCTKRGQDILVLLMWVLGTRNAETCAVTFGDIHEMACHPGNYTLTIYKNLERGTSITQTGGKTGNADREIPLPDKLAAFLFARKKYVEEWLKENDEEVTDVNRLPIGCFGDDCKRTCAVRDLTAAAGIIFRDIKLDSRVLAYIAAEIARNGNDIELAERDPTTYMLRRNLATIMLILGLEESEIEGVMGHDILDLYETRNEFVYEDNLFRIKQKMEKRPLIGSVSDKPVISLAGGETVSKQISNEPIQVVNLKGCSGLVKIHVDSLEPNDPIRVTLNGTGDEIPSAVYYEENNGIGLSRTVNITKQYRAAY